VLNTATDRATGETGKDLTTEQLGEEITTLAAHLSAATCRWLELIAEFDAREGWADWGCKSTAHWIAWRCSMGNGAAREQVRVARRLRELPEILAAFRTGELSFSKVRALTRVEDVTDETELLELARHATAAQLERTVRGYRRVLAADAVREWEERFLAVETSDDGSVLIRGRLPREEGAVLQRALEIAREQLDREARGSDDVSAETPLPTASDIDQANADALLALADASLETSGGRSGGDRFQVVVHVDADALTGDTGGRADLEDAQPIAVETARRLCCDAAIVPLLERDGETLSVGRKTRSIPPALRRALRNRDGGCRSPAAPSAAGSTRTTSGTGPTAARPSSPTSSTCAATTTGFCTRAATRSSDRPAPPTR
jgi:hypothetical protein